MNVENRLRDLLGEAAAEPGAEPTPSKWRSVLGRASAAKRRRRTQGLVIAGLSTAAVIAVVVGIFLATDGDRTGPITQEPETAAAPAHLVVAEPGRLVVRSSINGEVLRVLVEGEEAARIGSRIAVSPDGSQVYFQKLAAPCDGGATRAEIVRMPISGGPLEHVVFGVHPVLDPTGEFLSYSGDDDNGCGTREMALQLHLTTGDVKTLSDSADSRIVFPSSSNPGGKLILGDEQSRTSQQQFIIDARQTRIAIREVVFPSHVVAGRAIAFVGDRLVVGTYALEGDDYVGTFDPLDGSGSTELFKLGPEEVFVYPDATGESFIVAIADGETVDGVKRWNAEDGFTRVGAFEASMAVRWARGPGVPPKHFVALTPDGKLEVRETQTGDVVRELRDDVDMSFGVPRLAVSPDGRYVYMDRYQLRECPDNPGGMGMSIARVSVASGDVESVVEGRDPAFSADGTKLAYVAGACGTGSELVVRDLASGVEERWQANPDDDSWSVESPHWSPDNRMIALTLLTSTAGQNHLLDTMESESRSLADAYEIELDEPDWTNPVGYLTEDVRLAFRGPEDTSELVVLDPVSGAMDRYLHGVPGIHLPVSMQASMDGRHLLFILRDGTMSEEAPSSAFTFSLGALDRSTLADDVLAAAWLERLPSAADSPNDGGSVG